MRACAVVGVAARVCFGSFRRGTRERALAGTTQAAMEPLARTRPQIRKLCLARGQLGSRASVLLFGVRDAARCMLQLRLEVALRRE